MPVSRGGQAFHTRDQIWKNVEAAGRSLIGKQDEYLFFFLEITVQIRM